jgi:magnesium-transporting ATPase (P-type)
MGESDKPWHARHADEVVAALGVAVDGGLAIAEVADRLAAHGRNALPEPPPRALWRVVLHQFASPLIILLFGAAGIALSIGETADAAVIAVVVLLNAAIGAVQEGRAERSLAALKKLTAQQARVVRDGRTLVVDAGDIVVGDVLVIAAGDAVVADARIVEQAALQVTEAALTGESVPVTKATDAVPAEATIGDRRSMVFAGTWASAGRGRAVVVATGTRTELGQIAALATAAREPPTPLERRVAAFGRLAMALAAASFVVVVAVGVWRAVPMRELLMVAVSQIVGLVPEGLPVAMTIALAVGVQRMARRRAIVRRLSAVEALGSTTVICSDKTGTLTRNEMTATTVVLGDERVIDVAGVGYAPTGALSSADVELRAATSPDLAALLDAAVLCNDATLRPPAADGGWQPVGDPTEVALLTLALKAGVDPTTLRSQHPRIAELPFDATAQMMATIHVFGRRDAGCRAAGDDEPRVIFLKGAPEVVLRRCDRRRIDGRDLPLLDEDRQRLAEAAASLAGRALRVLAFAVVPPASGPGLRGEGFAGLPPATLLGLVGQIDPPRAEVADAVARCRAAGIRPVMVTGDHKRTGLAIARTIGIVDDDAGDAAVVDGVELAALQDDALAARLPGVAVFTRVQPAQKLRIVEALQRQGHVVAMTGDGVNDAPALLRADVGVAMGVTGTDVAREAARIVLVDDNFATLVAAVEEGRVVYRNIKKAVLLLLSTSFAEVLVLLLALVLGHPPPFAAVQILWNNLVTEGLVTVNLVLEPPEGDEMRRPPIAVDEPLLDRVLLGRLAVMTATITAVTLGWFLLRLRAGVPAAQVQTETFTLLALCEWFQTLNCRSETRSALTQRLWRNPWLLAGLLVGNVLQALVVFAPPLQAVFRTTPFGPREVIALGAVASVVLWVEEARKAVVRRRRRQRPPAGAGPPSPREPGGSPR